jgi:hypothetical protein
MQNRIGLILTLFIFLSFTSCTKIMLAAYGAHMPRPESKLALLNYLDSKKMNTDNILFAKTEKDWFTLAKYGVELICFDKNHDFYWYKDTSQCNAPAFMYCENICKTPVASERINPTFKTDSIFSLTEDFLGNTPKNNDADYTIFIGWAKWNGRLNGDHVKIWEEALNKSGCKVKVYKVCLDPLKQWGTPSYKFSKKTTEVHRNKKGKVIK